MGIENCSWWLYTFYYAVYFLMTAIFFYAKPKALLNIYLAFSDKDPTIVFFFLFLLAYPLMGGFFIGKISLLVCGT